MGIVTLLQEKTEVLYLGYILHEYLPCRHN
jgi:hypothetical protein